MKMYLGGLMLKLDVIRAASISILVAACASSTEVGQKVSVQSATQIRPGVTDKATVESLLGAPANRIVAANGEEEWMYTYFHTAASAGAAAFVPYVGPFLPGSVQGNSQNEQVQVFFKGNIVSRCWVNVSNTTTTGSALGSQSSPTSAQADCANIGNLVSAQNQ